MENPLTTKTDESIKLMYMYSARSTNRKPNEYYYYYHFPSNEITGAWNRNKKNWQRLRPWWKLSLAKKMFFCDVSSSLAYSVRTSLLFTSVYIHWRIVHKQLQSIGVCVCALALLHTECILGMTLNGIIMLNGENHGNNNNNYYTTNNHHQFHMRVLISKFIFVMDSKYFPSICVCIKFIYSQKQCGRTKKKWCPFSYVFVGIFVVTLAACRTYQLATLHK